MRTLALFAAAAALVSGPAWAQAWTMHSVPEDGFSVSAPGVPTARAGVFTLADGTKPPSRVHTLRQGQLIYSVTVVDISKVAVGGDLATDQFARDTAIDLAARALTKGSRVESDIPSRAGNTLGRELNLIRPDRSESMMQILVVGRRLYIVEGKSLPPDAADNTADAIRFEESIAVGGGGGGFGGAAVIGVAPAPGGGGPPPGPVGGPYPPPPPPNEPVSVSVKAAGGRLTERWRWAPGGVGKVEYCRQEGRAAEKCVVADNPRQGDHLPATPTAPMISAVQTGQAWMSVGSKNYFCKHTTYTKNAPMEITCVLAPDPLPKETPQAIQAMANNAARFLLTGNNRTFYCRNIFPDPDNKDSQVSLNCSLL